MSFRRTLRTAALVLVAAAAIPALAADAPATRPAAAGEAIDFNRARQLLQREGRGEKLSPEDAAYLDRAKAEHARMQQQRGGGGNAGRTGGQVAARESTGMVPLTALTGEQRYKGLEGGLYGGGRNEPPAAHARLAAAAAAAVAPLDADGKPSPAGKVVLMSIGMSNTTQEFAAFKALADRDAAKSPSLVIVDAAQGGRAADDWANETMNVWPEADRRLAAAGVSARQVQVVWVKQAEKGPGRIGEFPEHARVLQKDVEKILTLAKAKYPNLKLAYLSSRIYAGNATNALNPEPYAYESAFSVRWVVEKQVAGDPSLNADPAKGELKAPVALWGPYLWADGTKPRPGDNLTYAPADFAGDGTHPSRSGMQKVADQLLAFFKSDPTAKVWFTKK
ncbi:MAG TPA: hypothetical protein VF796_16070 [Humisphaera sp.]